MIKAIQARKWLVLSYLAMIISVAAVLIINQTMAMTPWSLTLAFFIFLLAPGFALARLLRIEPGDELSKIMFQLILGLIFVLVVCTIGMIFGWSVFFLEYFYLTLIFMLITGSLVLDWRRQKETKNCCSCDWKSFFKASNLGYLIVIIIAAVVVIGVGIQGSLFRGGDANFHLAIMRKAFEGSSLSPNALSFIKSNTIHVAYGLPIWHIFLGFLTRLVNSDPFLVWKTVCIPLSIFAILTWYWLAEIIFKNRFVTFVTIAIFLNYIFNWNTGYLFTVIPLPDTLNNYLLLPLAVAIFVKYIFGSSVQSNPAQKFGNLKILGILVIFALLMANIHITQYLYFMIMVGLFGLLWLVAAWRSPDFKSTLVKIAMALGANLVIFLPFLAFIEIKSHLLSEVLVELWNANDPRKLRYIAFNKLTYYGKWALVLFTPTILFIRKQRAVLFFAVMFLFLVATFFSPISHFLVRVFGYIFVNRIFGSIIWHFLIFGLICGFIILLVDQLLNLLPKLWQRIANFIFILGLLALVWAQIKFQTAAKAYDWLFSKPVDNWFNAYYLWAIGALAVVTIGCMLLRWRKPKIDKFFQLAEPKNRLMASSILVALMVILFGTTYSYGWDYAKTAWQKSFITAQVSFQDFRTGESHLENVTEGIGGQAMMDFVKTNLPVKSVFLVPGTVVNSFPILLDQYMVAYPRKKLLLKTQKIYDDEEQINIEDALALLVKAKVDYILLTDAPDQNQAFFDRYPDNFEKIFSGDAVIYKFNS